MPQRFEAHEIFSEYFWMDAKDMCVYTSFSGDIFSKSSN